MNAFSPGPLPITRPALVEDIKVDVCVIGGGLTGISTGLHLAEAGLFVAVLEARHVGCGATGHSAGQIVTGFLPNPLEMSEALGEELTVDLQRLAFLGKERLKERIRAAGIDCDYKHAYVFTGLRPSHDTILAGMAEFWKARLGIQGARVLSRHELQEHVRSPVYRCGLYDPTGGSLNPRKLVVALASELAGRGGLIFEASAARRIERTAGRSMVIVSDHGSLRAEHLVLCAGARTGGIDRLVGSYVMPVRCDIVVTEKLQATALDGALPTRLAGSDWRYNADYWTVTAGNRILFGGSLPRLGLRLESAQSALAHRLSHVFPALRGVRIDSCWRGEVALTRKRLPQICRIGRNVWVAHGYNGVGLALAYLAGSIIADGLAGRSKAVKCFERISHLAFPSGLMALPAKVWQSIATWAGDLR
jgi:gamma-glutamylputrescine oxidase